jgi:hypothetical protein
VVNDTAAGAPLAPLNTLVPPGAIVMTETIHLN